MTHHERSFRTKALILKRRDFGEADRLLTILTPSRGKLEVVAKGARKPTSTKTGHVELFTKADMLISKGRNLDLVSQAEMIAPYLPLRESLERGAYANYVTELTDRFIAEADDVNNQAVFELLDTAFDRLCQDEDVRLVTRYFELRLLDLTGFRPELQQCVISYQQVQPEDQYFSFAEGGVVTPAHAHHATAITPINMVTLKVLRHLQRSAYGQIQSLQIAPALHTDLERVLLGYITHILERKLQSVDFIRKIRL
ncbi:MAG: DNA repair protein RecO [Anaerolineae bacterium]|nr:DNA repair protein RecO [Anaerolineae bacterium]